MADATPAGLEPVRESSRAMIRRVLRNPRVRKVQLAFFGSTLGDWAYGIGIVVWAFQEGGAVAVGAYQAARFVAMAVAGPIGGAIADRMPRRRFMITADVVRAVLVSIAAVVITVEGPALVVYVLAIVTAIVGAPFRAAQSGLLPHLVDSPGELTAANAVAGNLESIALFGGPALAGVLIGLTDVETVFWLNVATFVWSAVLLLALRVPPRDTAAGLDATDAEPGPAERSGFWTDLGGGFALIVRTPGLRAVAMVSGATGLTWGCVTVFIVLFATELLETGAEAVGYLNAVLGVATVVGGLVVLGRVSRGRLGQDMVVATLGWGLPLLAIAAFPSPATVLAALAVIGVSDSIANIGFETIPQRIAPPTHVSRVYAAMESMLIAPMALGAALAPWMADQLGLRASLLVVGLVAPTVALLNAPQLRRIDAQLTEPEAVGVLRAVPIFAAMSAAGLEALARTSSRIDVPAGDPVLIEGESSESFYVIVAGELQVTQDGRLLRTEGPGEYFGEIGLIRDVDRTATVSAVTDCDLLVVERDDFLAAVSGLGEGRGVLDDVVTRRLAG